MNNQNSALRRLQKTLKSSQAYLVSNPHDINYLCNFATLLPEEREAFLVVTSKKSYLIQSSFSPTIDNEKIKVFKGISNEKIKENLQQIALETKFQTLFLDEANITAKEFMLISACLDAEIENLDRNKIWQLRIVKTADEIKKIKIASNIAKKALYQVISELKVGMTELEIKRRLIQLFYKFGADGEAFPTIVAFGSHSALPHHQPLEYVRARINKLKLNTPVLIDCGAIYQGYRSDMTRTIWFGNKPSKQFLEVEKIVKAAYKQTINILHPKSCILDSKITAKDLDNTARSVIIEAGFGDKFIHTTGHGIGLKVHEPPSLNYNNDQQILPGMIITVEPGIYLEGKFGYRHENTVIVTKKGCKEITL